MANMVVHCKRESYDVYIGRPSKWGNPFSIPKDGDREEVINKYYYWLHGQIYLPGKIPPTIKEIRKALKGKVLGCWCAPKACHGDILAEIAN